MMNLSMSWDEIKTKARNGVSMSILADLNGVQIPVFKKCVEELEKQTGEKLVFSKPEKEEKPKRQTLDKQKVIEMTEQGIKPVIIAERLGVTPAHIYNVLHVWRRANPDKKARKPSQKTVKAKPAPVKTELKAPIPVKITKIMIEPGVADVIETNIDDLKDQIQKHLDQIEILKFQLQSWEALLNASEVVENKHKAGTTFSEVMDL